MVVVTGAAGFIGARTVEALRAKGVDVVSVDESSCFGARPEHAGIDLGRQVGLDEVVDWLRRAPAPRAIVHLGACTDTRETDRGKLRRLNVESSQALWRFATEARVPLIYASSAATYGDGTRGYDDDEAAIPLLRPLNLYGESKQEFDRWALAEERSGSAPPAWCGLKFFNVYGFGERHKGAMASVALHAFDQIRATGRVRLFKSHRPDIADGHQARDFIAVDDVARVIVSLVDRPVERGIFNLGTGEARTFLDLARAVFRACGRPEAIDFVDTPPDVRAHYQYFTQARMDRLRAAGYREPFLSIEEGVGRYVRRLDAAGAA